MAFEGPFPQQPEQAIVSYDYQDIADGSGVVILYGANKKTHTTDSYFLTTETIPSNEIAKDSGTHSNVSETKLIDLDFDLTFQVPKIIDGTCIFSVPLAINNQTTSASASVVCKIRKWDGTTETEISSASSSTLTGLGQMARTMVFSCDVDNESFAPAETLRITTEVYGSGAGGAGWHHVCIGHDPANRTNWQETSANTYTIFDGTTTFGDYSTTPQLKFYIPFRNQL